MQTKIDYIRGFKYVKPQKKRGYYSFTEFKYFNNSLVAFMDKYNKGQTMDDGYAYLPYQKIELSGGITQMIEIPLLKC